ILDMNGQLNLSVHGNQLGAGQTHTSGAGLGAWEVSLERALTTVSPGMMIPDGRAIVAFRGGGTGLTPVGWAQNRAGMTAKAYSERYPFYNPPPTRYPLPPNQMQLPQGSAVPWSAAGGAVGGSAPGAPVVAGSLNLPGYGGNSLYA